MDADKRPKLNAYEVGFAKPPLHTRFAKGKSGNPIGRPRKDRNKPLSEMLYEEANRYVTVVEDGKPVQISALRAFLRSLVAEAASGKSKAVNFVLSEVARIEAPLLAKVREKVALEIAAEIDKVRRALEWEEIRKTMTDYSKPYAGKRLWD